MVCGVWCVVWSEAPANLINPRRIPLGLQTPHHYTPHTTHHTPHTTHHTIAISLWCMEKFIRVNLISQTPTGFTNCTIHLYRLASSDPHIPLVRVRSFPACTRAPSCLHQTVSPHHSSFSMTQLLSPINLDDFLREIRNRLLHPSARAVAQ